MTPTPDREEALRLIREAFDGGVPLLYAEDRVARREKAEASLLALAADLEAAERERDEWKKRYEEACESLGIRMRHGAEFATQAESDLATAREALEKISALADNATEHYNDLGMADVARDALRSLGEKA